MPHQANGDATASDDNKQLSWSQGKRVALVGSWRLMVGGVGFPVVGAGHKVGFKVYAALITEVVGYPFS